MDNYETFTNTINIMIDRGIFVQSEDGKVFVSEEGKIKYKFLCRMIWPIVDAYWVSFVYISDLDSASMVFLSDLARNINEFATSLY